MEAERLRSKQEIRLLIACGRKTFHERQAASARRALAQPLDWAYILEEAQRHCVLPFLRANLRTLTDQSQADQGRIPAEAIRALDATVRGIAARNLASIGELARVMRRFSAELISAIPFKGPAAAVAAYGDQSVRTFADLDILIDRESLARASEMLLADGYRPDFTLTPEEARRYLRTECALRLQHPSRGSTIELHWRLFERSASIDLPPDALRKRSKTIAIAGLPMQTLAIEDLFLYLCIHGAKHCWERLEWIACVTEILENRSDLSWPALFARAEQYGTLRLLHLGLWLSRALFEVNLPEIARAGIAGDPKVAVLGRAALSGLFPERTLTHQEQRAVHHWFMLTSRERMADKMRVLLYSTFKSRHPEAQEGIKPQAGFAFLGPVLRPIRLLSQYGALALRRHSNGDE